MRKILTTPRFERRLASFIGNHPELTVVIQSTMFDVAADKTSTLRVHLLKGALKGCRGARISYEYRIVFVLKSGTVCFIDIGTHDDLYR